MKVLALTFAAVLFSVPCLAQTPSKELQESQAQTLLMLSVNSELKSQITSLENRLASAQVRIELLERANSVLAQENARVGAKLNAVENQKPSGDGRRRA
jgi:hypothetical protein